MYLSSKAVRRLGLGVSTGLLVLLATAACGGSSPTRTADAGGGGAGGGGPAAATTGAAAGGAFPDACTLLDRQEVAALLGKAVKEPERGINATGPDESDCDWQKADEDNFRLGLVQLRLYKSTKYLPRDAYRADEIVGDVQIAGASDGAFLTRSGKTTIGVNYTVKGRRVTIDVTVDGGDPRGRLDALQRTAAVVAGRL